MKLELNTIRISLLSSSQAGNITSVFLISEILSKAWRPPGTITITDLGKGHYNAIFSLLCDLAAVIQGIPWSVKEYLMLLEKGIDGAMLED